MESIKQNLILDVREIPPRFKHETIFKEWGNLPKNTALILINDHDPVPLYYQFSATQKGLFRWTYLERGPEIWRVEIAKGDFPSDSSDNINSQKTKTSSPQEEPLILDVRPIFERGESPCEAIDQAVEKLKPRQSFVLLVPFEPKPLFAKLGRLGFAHASKQEKDGTWRIEFHKTTTQGKNTGGCGAKFQPVPFIDKNMEAGDITLDARNLEPPGPLVKALEKLQQLKRGNKLVMYTDRKPMHLFIQLDERGFAYDCTEQPDHSFITKIWYQDESS